MLSEFGHKEFNSVCFDIYENGKIIEYTRDTRFWTPHLKDMDLDCKPEKNYQPERIICEPKH